MVKMNDMLTVEHVLKMEDDLVRYAYNPGKPIGMLVSPEGMEQLRNDMFTLRNTELHTQNPVDMPEGAHAKIGRTFIFTDINLCNNFLGGNYEL